MQIYTYTYVYLRVYIHIYPYTYTYSCIYWSPAQRRVHPRALLKNRRSSNAAREPAAPAGSFSSRRRTSGSHLCHDQTPPVKELSIYKKQVYVHIHICIYIYTCMKVYTCLHIHTCIYVKNYIYKHTPSRQQDHTEDSLESPSNPH